MLFPTSHPEMVRTDQAVRFKFLFFIWRYTDNMAAREISLIFSLLAIFSKGERDTLFCYDCNVS